MCVGLAPRRIPPATTTQSFPTSCHHPRPDPTRPHLFILDTCIAIQPLFGVTFKI
ncbi:hypothetical protein HanIR_Chr05g0213211 [Helianthus annuus]|nr:hypothetical protein HanIR_Chr05g0213211 [Helianthus annuus]